MVQTMRYEMSCTFRPGEKERRRGEREEGRAGAAAFVGRGAVVSFVEGATGTGSEEGG